MLSRLAVLLHLVLLGAGLCAWLPADCAAQGGAPAKKAVAKKEAPDLPTWEVKGWGQTQEDAELSALKKARDVVEDYLRRRSPPVRWTPTVDYVRDHLKQGAAQRREELDQDVEVGNAKMRVKCWTITVSITPQERKTITDLYEQERAQERRIEQGRVAQERMVLLTKVLVGVVAGLLALLAYLRLDDATKGYYSRWLAAGAVVVAAAVGLSVWIR
jgi:hypothetical protein